ncbi:MAG: exo-alpha-sialidase [Sporichthyaceae bacterium]|nr:exo-alpha-sialidase [Sporichthyaceae bacterium]
MTTYLLAIGTRKGLFVATSSDRRTWAVERAPLGSIAVYAVGIDTRRATPRLLASSYSKHWGPSVAHSDDLGKSWHEPEHAPVRYPEWTEAALKRVWQLQPGLAAQPEVVWAGAEPGALFKSEDGGVSFELVGGLWNHPQRAKWDPGNGGLCLHTVIPHPADPQRMTVAVSTGGVYQTADAGTSWAPANIGIRADFLPGDAPEFGQCVHKVAMHPSRPEQLFAQNHGGVYRSDDGGQHWVSIADGLPSDFGFPIVAHPHRPGTVYVFPLAGDFDRRPPGERARVYRTDDAGSSWQELSAGLPQEGFHPAVLRDAMCTDGGAPAGIYFGTRSGAVFASADEGESWQQVGGHLPDVLSVRAAVLD